MTPLRSWPARSRQQCLVAGVVRPGCSDGRLFTGMTVEARSAAFTENRCSDADMSGAECDGGRKIGTHSHGQERQAVAPGNLGGEPKVGRGRFVRRRKTHEPSDFEPKRLPARFDEG